MLLSSEPGYLPLLMAGENLVITCCYLAIGSGIAAGIWRNREAGVNPVVVTVSAIFFSCALGHGMHGLGMIGLTNAIAWQTAVDLITVAIAIKFLSFYGSFDVLARISQIAASKAQLETDNQELQQAIEELKKTQLQLVQAEKMSSLGQLVAGIAHEVNNPINFIHGNLQHIRAYANDLLHLIGLYQQHSPATVEIEAQVEAIDLEFVQIDLPKILTSMELGTERIGQIVQSLRNFSRLDEAEFKTVDIHEGIESTLLILQHRLKNRSGRSSIQIIRDYDALPQVDCYSGQLNQVFMNILANAIDAIDAVDSATRVQANLAPHDSSGPITGSGQITICTSVINATWVQISIADNGIGIPESIQQQIFNPFFTTKPVGKGTGLGMSISYQIITETHGGKLQCFSTPGRGTDFLIQIPIQQRTHQ